MITLGQASILAILSFVVGRIWASSERIFERRQDSYATFLRKSIVATELLLPAEEGEMIRRFQDLKEASAEFDLYASTPAQKLAGEYLGLVSRMIVLSPGANADELLDLEKKAHDKYNELTGRLRADAMGWTLFGLFNRLRPVPSYSGKSDAKRLE